MAKKKIIWSESAVKDFDSILSFYEERNGNSRYSQKLLAEFKKITYILQKNNWLGRPVNKKGSSTRVIVMGNFLMFYEVKEIVIEVKLIWDNRRNPEKLPDISKR